MIAPWRGAAALRGRWHIAAALGLLMVPAAYLLGIQSAQPIERISEPEPGEIDLERQVMAVIAERHPEAPLGAYPALAAVLLRVAREAEVDYRLLFAIVEHESGFFPDKVGSSGEIGLMQILPATAEAVAQRLQLRYTPPTPGPTGRYAALGSLADPTFNLRVGTAYLGWQIARFGLNATALRAYNRSPARALERRPEDRYAEDISLRYVALAHSLRAP